MSDQEDALAFAAEPFLAILPARDGSYMPAAEGDPDAIWAHQLPVVSGEDLIDVVAWQWDEPRIWWRAWGRGTHLGDHCLWRPSPHDILPQGLDFAALAIADRWRPPRVLLVETPADYLANRGDHTVCIVDWRSVDLLEVFDQIVLVFASPQLQRHFDKVWQAQARAGVRQRMPRYKVAT